MVIRRARSTNGCRVSYCTLHGVVFNNRGGSPLPGVGHRTQEPLLQPARPRLILGHHRPVVFALAMGERADQAIAPDIAAR